MVILMTQIEYFVTDVLELLDIYLKTLMRNGYSSEHGWTVHSMKLHLTYCSSEEGLQIIKLYKYLRRRAWNREDNPIPLTFMTYRCDDLTALPMKLEIYPTEDTTKKTIWHYDNIRIALKSIFPTLFDLTPTKRVPLINNNRAKIIDMLP